jgi:peptide/nickel transport system permease protein
LKAGSETPVRRLWADFSASRLACVALAVATTVLLLALLAPWIAPQNPYDLQQLSVLDSRLPPASAASDGRMTFWLGTDDQGRDMLSAILYGLRISMLVGLLCTSIAAVIGTALGLVAAWFGGAVDAVLMRLADTQLAFPSILIALILLALLGKGADKIVLALVLVQWTYYARTARSSALIELRKDYVEAARGLQLPRSRILFVHVLPNCLPPLLVVATIQIAIAIGLEATLSFLGLGLPVTEPSLGLLIANGYGYLLSGKYWISFFPGLALLLAVLSINTVADQLSDVLNPRLQR